MAKEIAAALGIPRGKGCYQSEHIIVSNCIGHLLEYNIPEAADYSLPLPLIPREFILKPKEETKQQYDFVVGLMNRADVSVIVNACDAEREGENIFYRVYESAGCLKPVKRMWILSTTKEGYLEAWHNLKDGADFYDLYLSAKSRAEADWLLGINGSRAIYNNMGRVMTPTLAMVVDAYHANRNFIPQDYWEVHGNFVVSGGDFNAKLLNKENKVCKFDDLESAKSALVNISQTTDFTVHDDFSLSNKSAPRLFSATELQKQANKQLKFSAEKTLSVMQSLYQDYKCLTYPRSDFDALPEDFLPTITQTLDGLGCLREYRHTIRLMNQANLIVQNPRVFDNGRIDSHYAVVPTGFIKKDGVELPLSQLSEADLSSILPPDEYAVFNMVALRTMAAFFPPAQYAVTTRTAVSGSHVFQTTGKVLKQQGWLAVYGGQHEAEEATDTALPDIHNGERTLSHNIALKALKTQAPKLLSDAALLTAMENAGRKIDDEQLSGIMKATGGLGTAATRPAIIAKLKEAKKGKLPYVAVENNRLVPTERAVQVINHLRQHYPDAVNPVLTAEWESKLAQMAKGQYPRERFMAEIESTVFGLVSIMQANKPVPANTRSESSSSLPCPCCDAALTLMPKSYTCRQCGLTVWKTIAGKALSEAEIKSLLEKGTTGEIKGFVSKSGKPFNAKLMINREAKKVEFQFNH